LANAKNGQGQRKTAFKLNEKFM